MNLASQYANIIMFNRLQRLYEANGFEKWGDQIISTVRTSNKTENYFIFSHHKQIRIY